MENTLYYTLSTLPQILASILALTAVFVAMQLNNFKKEILGYGQRILDRWQEIKSEKDWKDNLVYEKAFSGKQGNKLLNQIRGAISVEDWNDLIERIKKIEKLEKDLDKAGTIEVAEKGFHAQVTNMEKAKKLNNDFLGSFHVLVVSSILSVTLSVVCLMFVGCFAFTRCYAYSVLSINILFFLFVLFLASDLIYCSIKQQIKN